MTLPHVNSDDNRIPRSTLHVYRLKNCTMIFYKKKIILSCILRSCTGGHPEYLKLLKGARVASTGLRKYRVK